ncbi:MAG: hypothetical protein LBJ00_11755 [Planctomycetaceae bacterium]|nr:hypothetical protein [Planctomycetaceae bacterium]
MLKLFDQICKRNNCSQTNRTARDGCGILRLNILDCSILYQATLKFVERNTQAQQREAVVQGRSLLPYRLRYIFRKPSFAYLTGK